MRVIPVKTRLFKEEEDLFAFILEHISKVKEGSIVAIASKIVALAEGRTVAAQSRGDKEALIRSESEWRRQVLPRWWLTVRDGTVVVNAGIDESNSANGKLILLPEDSFASAKRIHSSIMQNTSIKNLGIIITDSRITPLRSGVVGVALGYAGFKGIRDYRGTPDLSGRLMEVTQTDVADSLATAATLVCGESNEQTPLAIIEDAPVEWVDEVDPDELKMHRDQDLFKHLFE